MSKIRIHYFANFDRSGRIRWLLEEMNLPYEDKQIDGKAREHKSPAFLAINPMGAVPVIEWDGNIITESTGILQALTDRYAEKGFGPALDSPDRAYYFQWHSFACSSIETALVPFWIQQRAGNVELQKVELDKIRAEKLPEVTAFLEKRLSKHEFLVGNSFTSADISVASSLFYGERVFLEGSKIVQDYWKRMSERPAAKRAKLFG